MNLFFAAILRVLLVIMFAGVTGAQIWVVPQFALSSANLFPELAYLAVPYATAWIAVGVCAQVVIVAIWVLISKIRRSAIFNDSAFAWVNAIIGAGGAATALIFGVEFHQLAAARIGPPLLVIAYTGLVAVGLTFVLVMLVMRGLLRSATALKGELEEVV